MKIALVHDYLVQHGGAERVLEAFTEIFPHAPIFTLLHNRDAMHGLFDDKTIITSSLQKHRLARLHHRIFPPLMPSAIEEFDFSLYDVVLSDSSSFAKGIITRPGTLHISYVHTPMRYAWDDCQKYASDFTLPKTITPLVPFLMNYIRLWDYHSATRVDHYIANSHFVAHRIKKYWHKDAHVIHPPITVSHFAKTNTEQQSKKGEYYLMVGRLIAYKRHDIVIEAFNTLGYPLKIIGRGPQMRQLRKNAKSNITFLGRVNDADLAMYYAHCKGFIFPQEEDFGIVAIEAMASGKPLIAYRGGDIVEHMKDGVHGVFFDEQTPQALRDAVHRFEKRTFSSARIAQDAKGFDKKIFQRKIKNHVIELCRQHNIAV